MGFGPGRGQPEVPAAALPAEVVHLLVKRVGLPENEVAEMSKAEAIERLKRFWTSGQQGDRVRFLFPAPGIPCWSLTLSLGHDNERQGIHGTPATKLR